MFKNRTREILEQRGETNYTLYQKIKEVCAQRGETVPSYNTLLAFVRDNSIYVNKRMWRLVAYALNVDHAVLFEDEEDNGDRSTRYAAQGQLATA